MLYPFHPLPDSVDLACTSVSAFAAAPVPRIPTGGFEYRVVNSGTKNARFRLVTDAATPAVLTDTIILAGATEVFHAKNQERAPIVGWAGITSGADTTTLTFTIGAGI
jgi:hypothetical protein